MKRTLILGSSLFASVMLAADAGTGVAANPAPTTDPVAPAAPFVYDEQRKIFTSAEADKAKSFVEQIASSNIRVEGFPNEWPEGADIAVLPLSRNEKVKDATGAETTKRICHGVLVWPLFPVAQVLQAKGGDDYIRDVVYTDQMSRILQPMRKQDWSKGQIDASASPKTIADHIEGMASDRGVVKAYMEQATEFLKSFKRLSPAFAHFTPQLLRQYLASAAVAKALNPDWEAKGFWVQIINKLKAATVAANGPTELYDQWLATRDEATEIGLDNDMMNSLGLTL